MSQVQARALVPVVTPVGSAAYGGVTVPQHTIAITQGGRPWVIGVDEIGQPGTHFVDITDPAHPVVHPGITLEIQRPENAALASEESRNDALGLFGYSPHYCSVDRVAEPTALACGYFQAGVRVFDIRDLLHPREIAYFNPPAQSASGKDLSGSQHSGAGDLSTDWCSSPPRFVGSQLWVTCQDNGFMILRFAPTTYPLAAAPAAAAAAGAEGDGTSGRAAPALLGAALAVTGAPGWIFGVATALAVTAVLLRVVVRRAATGKHPVRAPGAVALILILLSATVLVSKVGDDPPAASAANVAFAGDMIAHHTRAIAIARLVEADPRATPDNRVLALQIDRQQTAETDLLRAWLRHWNEPDTSPAVQVATSRGDSANAFNRWFMTAMAEHHATAVPIVDAAIGHASDPVQQVAAAMLVDQATEMSYMHTRLALDGTAPEFIAFCSLDAATRGRAVRSLNMAHTTPA